MIPTSNKSNPQKGLTHAIGAKQISELLEKIYLYDQLTISFDKDQGGIMGIFTPGWTGRYIQGDSKVLMDFKKIISVSYSEPLNSWKINIASIEIPKSKLVRKFLIEIGIPLLSNWLNSKKPETWFSGNRHFQIGINEQIDKFCTWETHNDFTVKKHIQFIK